MNQMHRLQQVSGLLRYLTLLTAGALALAVGVILFSPGQDWFVFGDGQLNALYAEGAISPGTFLAATAPVLILLGLGCYWLQRLFGEYQAGAFFTDGSMRCYVWLVWLKAGSLLYSMLWPQLLAALAPGAAANSVGVTVELGSVVELVVLLLIVHILREAQRIAEENREFV